MTEIPIYANIIKPIDELENEIFFALKQTELKSFMLSLDEKVGNVDFTIGLIKDLTDSLIDFYQQYTENVTDNSFKCEYEILKEIKLKLDDFRKDT